VPEKEIEEMEAAMEQRRTVAIRQPCMFVLWNTLLTKRLCHRVCAQRNRPERFFSGNARFSDS
jgi:hypothetical protein